MSEPILRILLVEDNPNDAQLVILELRRAGLAVEVTRVETEPEYLAGLSPLPDLVLSDYQLPDFDAFRALEALRARSADVPFILVSGTIGDEMAVLAMKSGATDYLLKDRLGRLGIAVSQAVEQRRLREANQEAQRALRESEEQYRVLADSIPDIVWTSSPAGAIEYVNRQGTRYTGCTVADFADGSWGRVVHPHDIERIGALWHEGLTTGLSKTTELRLRRVDGEYRWHLTRQEAVRDASGAIVRWFGTCTDVHDQKVAAAAVEANEARWRRLLDNLFAGVALLEPNGSLVWANGALLEISGTTLDQVAGKRLWECAGWCDDPNLAVRVEAAVHQAARGELTRFDATLRSKSGTRTILDFQVAPLRNEAGEVIYLIPFAVDVTAREVATSELRLRDRAIQAVSQGILIGDATLPGVPIVYASPAFEHLTGYGTEEVLGRNCRFLAGPDTDPATLEVIRCAIRTRAPCSVEMWNYRKDGTPLWMGLSLAPVFDGERVTHMVGVQTDMTARRKLEENFRQAQKMEAFGQLAGGIAHDFNNLLCVINGEAEVLGSALDATDTRQESVQAIQEGGLRAASLTAQLLSFSRKTILEPRVLDLNEVVERDAKLLGRVLGEDIAIDLALGVGLARVKVDPGQIEQVIMNLALNARDAMPQGGRLTIATRNGPGAFVVLSVSDTGSGMASELLPKIFEPFFTTKSIGKGSGLGLATVYGIVTSSNGTVNVTSEVGHGTTFTVTLPAVIDVQESPAPAADSLPRSRRGSETVLIVEDEPAVRRVVRMTLESNGYEVLEADSGASALRIAEGRRAIHLLVTDVVMPEMGGREVAERVMAKHPNARVLYTSGYTDDAVVRNGVSEATDAFLQKPFTPSSLAEKVRSLLDRR
jgi:two-component system, cell cycle sensor histidine kinase and response regulator CckA